MKMASTVKLCMGGFLLAALSGCIETDSVAATPPPAAVPADSLEGKARAACVGAVRTTTNNPAVSVIRSSFSEAGTEVILKVGETGTWRCIGYRDGTTAGVMSITDEGAL